MSGLARVVDIRSFMVYRLVVSLHLILSELLETIFIMFSDLQKVATTRPLVAEIFSDCGRIKNSSIISSIMLQIIQSFSKFCMARVTYFCGNFGKS